MKNMKQKILVIAAVCCFSPISVVTAQRTFEINEVHYTQDFSSYEEGSTLTNNGWTLSGAGVMTIGSPGGSGQTFSQVVKLPHDDTRRVALSPAISVNPGISLGDTVFLSAQVWAADAGSSGVAIGLRDSEGQDLFFLRVVDTNSNTFSMRGPTGSQWFSSEDQFSRMIWYELLVAVDLHATDITKSTGSLFYRELLDSDKTFIPVAGVQDINLGFTEGTDPLDMAYIRIELARYDVEFTNIRIGTCTIIPEAGHVSIIFGALIFAGVLLRHRLSR